MIIDFNIYNSIVFGELRPWFYKLNEDAHKHNFTDNVNIDFNSLDEFEKTFFGITSKNKLISYSNDYRLELYPDKQNTGKDYNEITQQPVYIELPKPENKFSAYYFFLIINETHRLISRLNLAVYLQSDKEQKKYTIMQFLEYVDSYYEETTKHINHADKNSAYIYSVLCTCLNKLIFEVKSIFPKLIEDTETSINDIRKLFPNAFIITSSLTRILVADFIKDKSIETAKAIALIDKIRSEYLNIDKAHINNPELIQLNEQQIDYIKILENIVCMQELGYKKGNQNNSTQLEQQNINNIFSNYKTKILKLLEKTDSPAVRTNTISDELEKLYFLDSAVKIENPKLELSLPRKIRNWLYQIQEAYKTNPSYIPAELKENPKLKTNLSVEQIAYLFKALHELKSQIFDVKSNEELYRFIVNNFSSKRGGNNSTEKLKQLFNEPDLKAVDFWKGNFSTLQSNTKKTTNSLCVFTLYCVSCKKKLRNPW